MKIECVMADTLYIIANSLNKWGKIPKHIHFIMNNLPILSNLPLFIEKYLNISFIIEKYVNN